jgi:hypothetical protein
MHGAARDGLSYAESVADRELAAEIDNPVVLGGRVESNGNFHGAPLAYVLDFLALPVADVASIAERRTEAGTHGLPPNAHDTPHWRQASPTDRRSPGQLWTVEMSRAATAGSAVFGQRPVGESQSRPAEVKLRVLASRVASSRRGR